MVNLFDGQYVHWTFFWTRLTQAGYALSTGKPKGRYKTKVHCAIGIN